VTATGDVSFGADGQLTRLLDVREALRSEQQAATSPGVARALETADYYLFIAVSYLGYVDHLFPEQDRAFETLTAEGAA
jgi:hypothetical protein